MTDLATVTAAQADQSDDVAAQIAATRQALAEVRASTARALSFALERLDARDYAAAREMIVDALALHSGQAPGGVLQ